MLKKLLVRINYKLFASKKDYNQDYLQAYISNTDFRVKMDPKSAIGGQWEQIGKLQFNFLIVKGLIPGHKMLDIGCGTLRGGLHFIRHLNSGNYTGIDISPEAIKYANKVVINEGLVNKQPTLILNVEKNLKFEKLPSKSFDFIIAQSVFTHLKPEHIEECFANIHKVMKNGTVFYFTYFRNEVQIQTSLIGFCYPISFFENLASKYNFYLFDFTIDYSHPRKQNMLAISVQPFKNT